MKCYNCNGYHNLGESCTGNRFDRYELPAPPPPLPVRDISFNTIGFQDFGSSQIRPINNMINGGMPLQVQGTFVRDTMGNLVGQMGPGNMMFPPPSFGPPKPGGF